MTVSVLPSPHLTADGFLAALVAAFATLFGFLASILAFLIIAYANRMRKNSVTSVAVLRNADVLSDILRGALLKVAPIAPRSNVYVSILPPIPLDCMKVFDDMEFLSAYSPRVGAMFAEASQEVRTLAGRLGPNEIIGAGDVKRLLISAAWRISVARSRLKWRAWVLSSRAYVAMFLVSGLGLIGLAGLVSLLFLLQFLARFA
jgi:hypothetical protein